MRPVPGSAPDAWSRPGKDQARIKRSPEFLDVRFPENVRARAKPLSGNYDNRPAQGADQEISLRGKLNAGASSILGIAAVATESALLYAEPEPVRQRKALPPAKDVPGDNAHTR